MNIDINSKHLITVWCSSTSMQWIIFWLGILSFYNLLADLVALLWVVGLRVLKMAFILLFCLNAPWITLVAWLLLSGMVFCCGIFYWPFSRTLVHPTLCDLVREGIHFELRLHLHAVYVGGMQVHWCWQQLVADHALLARDEFLVTSSGAVNEVYLQGGAENRRGVINTLLPLDCCSSLCRRLWQTRIHLLYVDWWGDL